MYFPTATPAEKIVGYLLCEVYFHINDKKTWSPRSFVIRGFIKEIRYGERKSALLCQRFNSLVGPSDWWFLIILSISRRSLAGRSPGIVFLTLDVALP